MRALFAALLVVASPLTAQTDTVSWMRYPAISPDGRTIVFAYRGDLYRVSSSGGVATALTSHPAPDWAPVWSPDSRTVVFASTRYGNADLFAVSIDGGEPRRLTYYSGNETPYAVTRDGYVLYGAPRLDAATSRLHPTAAQPELYRVPLGGGRPVQVLTTPAEAVAPSRDGRRFLYVDKPSQEDPWRKHHRSAATRDIWVHDRDQNTHVKLTSFDGEDRDPVFSPDESEFRYLSELNGSFNVFSQPVGGGTPVQLTQFTGAPVRFLTSADDGTLAFGHDGLIYTMRVGGQPARVNITISADAKANNERIIPVTGGASGLAVSPTGKEVAYIYRGDVFVTAVEGGMTRQVTRTPEMEHGVQFSPDGKTLVYASERTGRWSIWQATRTRAADRHFYAATAITETPLIDNDNQNFQPQFSPDGKEIAFVENYRTLRVMNLASKESRTLANEGHIWGTGPGLHYTWSPDGKWILFNMSVPGLAPGEVGLVNVSGRDSVINLTRSGFSDFAPRWVLGGAAMIWRSNRDGLRNLAEAGGGQSDIYAMYFTQEAWDRSRLTKEELALVKEAEEEAAKAKGESRDSSKATPVEPVKLDIERSFDRKVRLTTHSSSLGDALLSKDGETLYYLAAFERGHNLWSTSLRTGETKMVLALNSSGGSMQWDKEQKKIFLLSGGSISTIDPATAKREMVTIRGEMVADGAAERAAGLDVLRRKVRDTFYKRDFHGADWEALTSHYARYLPHIDNNRDFAEMLSELLGELNVSHSGARYGTSTPTDDATASLGVLVDLTWTGTGVPIVEVLRGGPLDRAGLDVAPGTIIEAIDGVVIDENTDYARLLNRKAGKFVLVRLRNGNNVREEVIKPISLGAESQLLYRRWVQRNEDEVRRLSDGRLGYIHVPGMNDGAYRNAFEETLGKFSSVEALVVDTRWNGGGDLVADLDMFLTGKKFFEYTDESRPTGYEPHFRWTRPSIVLANEGNYSDGHCFAWTVKHHQIGKLVGMPVPGTCTFAGGTGLLDGVSFGAPSVGVRDATTGRFLENWQTDPDILVRNDADVVAAGRDQQLEAAVTALMADLNR